MEQDRHEWASFKAMPFKKKLEHIWIYYRWYILAAVVLICMAVSIAGAVAEGRKEVLISGIFINNSTSEEGYAYLTDGYWAYCGGSEDQKADLVTGRTIHFDSEVLSQDDAASFMVVSSMIAAGTLDYIITDEDSVDDFVDQEVVLDLRQLLPEEVLAQWDTIEHNGAVTALRLEGTGFAEKYPLSAESSCILVVSNAKDPEGVTRFLEYLLN